MATLTQSFYPFSDVCIITKKSKYSTVVIVAKLMNRVVVFDALTSIVNETVITYVGRELDKYDLHKKFLEIIGRMITKDVGNKYFLADYENLPIDHLSNGPGAKDLNPLEIKKLEECVRAVRFNDTVENAINELIK